MPIIGTSLGDAARRFQDHLNDLLTRTITQTRIVVFTPKGSSVAQVGFRQAGGPIAASLGTNFGELDLSVLQICDSEEQPDGLHRLRTAAYTYTLTPQGSDEPAIRWEYLRTRPDPEARWARHHVQGPFLIGLQMGGVSANALHIPTGFVTVEEVIRFCIADLGVNPLSNEWNERLEESYTLFKTDFALPDRTNDSPF